MLWYRLLAMKMSTTTTGVCSPSTATGSKNDAYWSNAWAVLLVEWYPEKQHTLHSHIAVHCALVVLYAQQDRLR